MHGMPMALLMLATAANAAVVQRCEGPDGHVTFTHTNCPASQPWQHQRALNPSSGHLPMARPAPRRALPVTVVEDSSRPPQARQHSPIQSSAKKRKGSKKKKYVSPQQMPAKLKTQKAKSPQ